MKLETRTIEVMVVPEGEPTFSDQATRIRIDDEAAGEYLLVEQSAEELKAGQIWIDPKQWPTLRDAIDHMISHCREPS